MALLDELMAQGLVPSTGALAGIRPGSGQMFRHPQTGEWVTMDQLPQQQQIAMWSQGDNAEGPLYTTSYNYLGIPGRGNANDLPYMNPDGTTGVLNYSPDTSLADFAKFAAAAAGVGGLFTAGAAGALGGAAGGAGGGAAGGVGLDAAGMAAIDGTGAAGVLGGGAGVAGAAGAAGGAGGAGSALGSLGNAALNNPGILATGLGALAGAASAGPQTATSQTQLPAWMQPYAEQYAQRALDLSNQPFVPYTGQLTAGMTDAQNQAISNLQGIAGGTPLMGAAQQQQQATIGGQYLNNGQNQQNAYMGQTVTPGSNQYIGQTIDPGRNQFLGLNNPYLSQAIDAASEDTVRNFQLAVRPGTDSAASAAGGYGGSAWQQLQAENARQLAKQLGNIATNMRYGDYSQQLGLAESDLNRRLGAAQTDLARNSGLAENDILRRMQAQQMDLARNASLYEGLLGRNQNAYQFERGLQQQASLSAPMFQNAQLNANQALMNAGTQQQLTNQMGLDAQYQQFLRQQQHPQQQLATLGSIFGQGFGQQTTQTQPGVSTGAGILGGALTGLGIYNMGRNTGLWGG